MLTHYIASKIITKKYIASQTVLTNNIKLLGNYPNTITNKFSVILITNKDIYNKILLIILFLFDMARDHGN